MQKRRRQTVRILVVLGVLAMVAAACGGRLSEAEIQAELAADGGGAGSGSGSGGTATATGSDGTGDGVTSATATGGGSGSGSATAGGGGGSSDGGGGDTGGASGGDGGPAPTAPPGGNGGATDVGVTETEIVVGNVATLGGPVPGLFRGALIGTQARFALANSEGGVNGRQIRVVSADDNFDAGQHRAKVRELKDQVFAFVGSFSLFDGAAAPEIESSGVVDIGRALLPERQALATHYSPFPFGIGWPTTGCKFLKQKFGAEKIQKMAIFWGNADAARNNAAWQRKACEAEGFEFVYEREFQATESNFTGDVIQMRNRGVEGFFVVFDVSGIARFMKSLHQQGFDPPIKYPSPAAYDSDFIKLAGADAVEGTVMGHANALYLGSDAGQVPEIATFNEWMARIDPSQKIDIFGLYGWLSASLLIEALEKSGPEATRQGVLDHLATVTEWNNAGITPPINVAAKTPAVCEMYLEIKGGQFQRLAPAEGFICDGRFVEF